MKITSLLTLVATILLGLSAAQRAVADAFGSGANQFDIEFVTIGNPGNAPDTTGNPNPAGAVPYVYRIGKFEISEQMVDKANTLGGLGITKDTWGPDKPATLISWNEAARFVNWLNTSTGSMPAYKFATQPGEVGYSANANGQLWDPGDAGYNPNNLFRNSLALFFLPSVHEWYKAAYYDPTSGNYFDYPTGSNSVPTPVASGTAAGTAVYDQNPDGPANITLAGGLSPYGTMAQGGNVTEVEENLTTRGGSWSHSQFEGPIRMYAGQLDGTTGPQFEFYGIRVASVPEPSSLLLAACVSAGLLAWRKR